MEIDRKIIAASSWIKNGIIEIYNTLFFREYFIKIYIFFWFCKPCQRIYIMFFTGKTVFFFVFFFYQPHIFLLFHIREWRRNEKLEVYLFRRMTEWVRSFLCCCCFSFCTIHSIKLEFAVNLLNNTIRFSKKLLLRIIMTIYLFHFVVKIPYGSPSFLIICDIKNYINQIRCLTSRTFHFPQNTVLVCFEKFNFSH